MSDVKDAVVKRIRALCEEKNIKPNEIANRAGFTPSTVYSIFTEKNNTEMSYTDSQSIIQSGGGLQNFSPGAVETVESDGLIDGIDRNAVEEEVKAQIDYDCLMSFKDDAVVKMVEEIKDLMVDVLCGERTVISEGKRVSEETAKAAYRKITFEHVQYVLHSLVNYPDKISRIDRFLTTSLFNSVYTMMNSTFAGFEHDMGMKLL